MTLFHFISLCPISNPCRLASSVVTKLYSTITVDYAQSAVTVSRLTGSGWHLMILPDREDYSILGFYAVFKQRLPPRLRQFVVTSSSESSWDCLTPTTTALRLFETSGPTYLTTYPGRFIYILDESKFAFTFYISQHLHITKFQVIHKFGPPPHVSALSRHIRKR